MIKFNKAALAVLALCAAGSVSAAMYELPPGMNTESSSMQQGAYVGIGLGGIGFTNQASTQASTTLNGLEADSGASNGDGGNIGLNSYLLAGYAWHFPNKVFAAAEIFGNYTNVPVTINTSGTSTDGITGVHGTNNANINMTLKGDYGIRVLPGYQVTPSSTVYGIIGYSRAYTSTSTTNVLTSTGPEGQGAGYNLSASNHYWFNGLQLGLGSMIKVTESVALRGDLIWTGYENQTLDSVSSTSAEGSAQGSVSAQPTTLEADVGLVYMFD